MTSIYLRAEQQEVAATLRAFKNYLEGSFCLLLFR